MIPIPAHIKGLIFDLDGTIADTMPLHFQAWTKAMTAYGLIFTEEKFYAVAGITTLSIIEALACEQNKIVPAAEAASMKECFFEELLPSVKPIDSVLQVIRDFSGKLAMAVATGGIRRLCERTLDLLGLGAEFQTVLTADEVPQGKATSEIFLRAAREIGIAPQFCAVFEDGELGLQAGRAAGMYVIDVRVYL